MDHLEIEGKQVSLFSRALGAIRLFPEVFSVRGKGAGAFSLVHALVYERTPRSVVGLAAHLASKGILGLNTKKCKESNP